MIIKKAITGEIDIPPEGISSEVYMSLHNFYKAFNNKDFTLIKENWLHSEEIAMDNPLGGIKRGLEEIEGVYKRIFSGKAKVYVEFYDYTIIEMQDAFCCVGRERGSIKVGDTEIKLAIRTSRVYKKVNVNGTKEYRQVHHHGSIEDPALLKKYQELLLEGE